MYMYTHIDRWWLSVLPLLMGREMDKCQEGILQEEFHEYDYIYSHSCPCHLCICQIIIKCFVNLSFFCYIYLFGGYEWRKKAENHITGLKPVYALAQPSVYRAVPHVHTGPPSHTAVSSGRRECFLCIGPFGKAGLPRVKAGVETEIIVADSE